MIRVLQKIWNFRELLCSNVSIVLALIICSILLRHSKRQSRDIFSSYAQYQDTLHLTRSDGFNSCANAHQINCYQVTCSLQFPSIRLALWKICGGQKCHVAAHLQLLCVKCLFLRHKSVQNLNNSHFEGSRRQKDIKAHLNPVLRNILSMKISSSG